MVGRGKRVNKQVDSDGESVYSSGDLAAITKNIARLKDTIDQLRNEVKVLRDTNIDLIRLLTKSKEVQLPSSDIITLESKDNIDVSFGSASSITSVETVTEKTKTTKKGKDKKRSQVDKTQNKNIQGSSETQMNINEPNKVRTIVGVNDGEVPGGFAAARPRFWIYVGRCKKDTNAEDVKAYIETRIADGNASVEKLQSRGDNASFRVGIEGDVGERLYDPTFWPRGVVVRRYRLFRGEFGRDTRPRL